jgi:hypothetical protein
VGKEISYCQACGHRIEHPFLADGRRYCEACRPADAVPEVPVTQRRQTSTRLRQLAPSPSRQQPPSSRRDTTRIRKRNPLPLVIGAAAVVAVAIGIAIAAGHPAPLQQPAPSVAVAPAPEPAAAPKPPPAPSVDETLARVRELRGSDLLYEKRPEIVRMLRELAGRAGPRLEEVDHVAAEYDRKFEDAAARLADFTRSEALRMASKQRYADAIERLDGYPEPFRSSKAAESLRGLRQDLEKRRAEAAAPAAGGSSPRRVL